MKVAISDDCSTVGYFGTNNSDKDLGRLSIEAVYACV